MSKAKKIAFTLGVAGMSLMPLKSIAQDQDAALKEYKKQMQTELREFKSAIDSAFVEFKAAQEQNLVEFRDAMLRAINNEKYANALAQPWQEYELQSDEVIISETAKRKRQNTR